MITNVIPNDWKDLQNKVSEILTRCGFSTQIEKKVKLARGSKEIDVYAEENIDFRKYSIIIECKYWKSNINQDIIHGFRTVANDLGCNKAYIISTSNFQKGAYEAIENTNIELLTWNEFQSVFFDTWYSNFFCETITKKSPSFDDYMIVDWFDDLNPEDKLMYSNLKNIITDINEITFYFYNSLTKKRLGLEYTIPKLPLSEHLYKDEIYFCNLPDELLSESDFSKFLKLFIDFQNNIFNELKMLDKKYKN